MSITVALLICLAAMLVLVCLEIPIALAILLSGAMGIAMIQDGSAATHVIGTSTYSSSGKYALLVVPMYVMLGSLISNVGIGEKIYRTVNRVVGRLPGGLAATAVGATAMFSGISGSSAADVATFGRVSVGEMTRYGYDRTYAAAVVAAAGGFAALIPPSVIFVIYGIVAEVSIGALIIAGIVPGVVSCLILATYVVIREIVRHRPVAAQLEHVAAGGVATAPPAPPAPRPHSSLPAPRGSWRSDIPGLFYALLLFAIVVGGLYAGIFTATEGGAMGAFAALVIALFVKKPEGQKFLTVLKRSLDETVNISSMIFLLLLGGAVLSYLIARSGVARDLSLEIAALDVSPKVIAALLLLILIPLGSILDGLTITLLTVPIMAPMIAELGLSEIWFGILVIKAIEIGLLTPPVGINAFIIAGVARVPAERVYRALVPFIVLDLLVTAVLFLFPEIILFLPRMAGFPV